MCSLSVQYLSLTLLMQASATWDKFRKERDFHRMHHKRVAQEKNKLIHDMQILKKHYSMVNSFLAMADSLAHQLSVATSGGTVD